MSASTPYPSAPLMSLFNDLAGTWLLNRKLQSANPSEPSGRCSGTATLTPRPSPSPVVDSDGKFHTADAELLYHEQGDFEMMLAAGNNLTSVPTLTFSRKYIWRLQKAENGHAISIWFTKPGTETIDYLFHKIDIPLDLDQTLESKVRLVLHGTGGHLCVDDFYSSTYNFTMSRSSEDSPFNLFSWTTVHEVLGPKRINTSRRLLSDLEWKTPERKKTLIPTIFLSITTPLTDVRLSQRQMSPPHRVKPLWAAKSIFRRQTRIIIGLGPLQSVSPNSTNTLVLRRATLSVKHNPEQVGFWKPRLKMATINEFPPKFDDLTLPEPFGSIARYPLTLGPSPIHVLPNISAALGGKVSIYAKREDLNSALAFGGNKTRKLEYLIPDALAQKCDTLVSIGGYQSNHTRQVAAVAAKLGLRCKLVQEKWVDHDDVGYDKVGNIQLSRLMSADVRLDQSRFGIEHKQTLKRLNEEVLAQGGKPYYIPAGASDHPLGGLGFARWSFEVAAQEHHLNIFFDTIIVCAVTGSTFAGMIAGFKLLEHLHPGKKRRIIGIDASAKPNETFAQVLRIARQTAAKIGLKESDISESDVILDTRYHAGTYGLADEATLDAIRFGAKTEAFITDPVYEGKSLAGLIDMVKKGEIGEGSNVLYAHLGGQLALNAYSEIQ